MNEVAPGEFIYLSERKLFNLATWLNIDPGRLETDRTVERGGRIGGGLSRVDGRTIARLEPLDPNHRDRALENLLEQIFAAWRIDLPDIDDSVGGVAVDQWFRFRRPLRFGMAHADSEPSADAFVLVDRVAVDEAGFLPGLLMNGSPVHVRDPYRGAGPGSRSGSGTDTLFKYLRRRDIALDQSVEALVGQPGRDPAPGFGNAGVTGAQMYRLFSDPHWLTDRAACEGVAQVSQIAATDDLTVVFASPLYVRRASESFFEQAARRPRGIARMLRRRQR